MSGKSVIRPYLTSASTFNNLAGGVLNIGTTGTWSFLSTSAAQEGIVNNSGTINVNSNTSWEAKFSQLAGGILNLHDGLSMQHLNVATGTINIDSGKTLWIPENHVGLNKFDGTTINGPGRLQIGNAVSSYSPTVIFNNVSTNGSYRIKRTARHIGIFRGKYISPILNSSLMERPTSTGLYLLQPTQAIPNGGRRAQLH